MVSTSTSTHALRLDDQRLSDYLNDVITEIKGPVTSRKFSGGQSNPTYLLNCASGHYVLRRKPPGKLLKSAHAVEREYAVMKALAETAVPVPQTFHLCNDESVIGSVFFIMQYIPGQIYWDPALPAMTKADRRSIYMQMCTVLATLHQVDIDKVGLSDYGKPGNYFSRQISRWSQQYQATETEKIAAMDEVINWLPANLPADDGRVSLVHGDFRMDNMIFTDNHEVVALLDWELSTLGHPFADLAYQCMQLRMEPTMHLSGLNGIDRLSLGIPSEKEYVENYCQHCGIERIDNWPFYLVFGFFVWRLSCRGSRSVRLMVMPPVLWPWIMRRWSGRWLKRQGRSLQVID